MKTNLLKSFPSQKKSPLKDGVLQTRSNDFVLTRSDFLRLVGDPNESIRLNMIYYMFKYSFAIKIVSSNQIDPLKAQFRKN